MPRKTNRTIITSKESYSNILSENIKIMEAFLKHKGITASPKTVKVYRSNLTIFLTWVLIESNNKHICDLKKLDFSDFFVYLSEKLAVGSSRRNNMRSTLSSLSKFIERFYDEEFPKFRNLILTIIDSAPAETIRKKTILTDEQVEILLNWDDSQMACWAALAVCSGARFTELLNFKTTHIDEENCAFGKIFLETTEKIKTKGRGKKGKLIYKYILREKFLPYYNRWLVERDLILAKNNKEHDFIFVKKKGEPATESVVRAWLRDFELELGVPVYAHAFRHYLVSLLSKQNIPHSLIKEIFGWETLSMVTVYDDNKMSDRSFKELEDLKV